MTYRFHITSGELELLKLNLAIQLPSSRINHHTLAYIAALPGSMQRILLVLHDLLPPPPLEAWLGNPVATDSTSVSLAPDLLPKIPTSSFGNGPKLSSQMYSFDYPAPLSNSSPAASTAAEAIPAVINKLYEQETTPYGRSKAFSKILPPHSSPTPLASSSTAANNRGLSLPHLSTPRSPAPSSGPSPSTAASKRKFCDLFDDDTPIKSLKRPAISVPPTRFSLALPPITSAARRHDTSQVGSSSAKRKRHRLDDGMPSKSPKRPAVSASPLAFHLALPPTGPVRNHQGASSVRYSGSKMNQVDMKDDIPGPSSTTAGPSKPPIKGRLPRGFAPFRHAHDEPPNRASNALASSSRTTELTLSRSGPGLQRTPRKKSKLARSLASPRTRNENTQPKKPRVNKSAAHTDQQKDLLRTVPKEHYNAVSASFTAGNKSTKGMTILPLGKGCRQCDSCHIPCAVLNSKQMPLFGCVGSREKGYQYCLTCHNRGIDCEFHTRYKARGSEEPAAKENGIAHKGKGKTAEYRLKSEERKQTANELSQAASGSQMEGHHSIPADGEGPVLECTSIGPQDKEPTDVIDLTLLEDTDDDEGDDLEEGPIGDHIARDPPGPAPAVHQPNEEEDEERGDDEESEDELEEVPIY